MALDQAALLARGTGPVLVQGEPGTGKGLYAMAIHDRSDRASRPLVRLASAEAPAPSASGSTSARVEPSCSTR